MDKKGEYRLYNAGDDPHAVLEYSIISMPSSTRTMEGDAELPGSIAMEQKGLCWAQQRRLHFDHQAVEGKVSLTFVGQVRGAARSCCTKPACNLRYQD